MSWTKTPGSVTFHSAHRVRLVDDVFAHLGSVGLNLDRGSQDVVVRGNVFTDISGTAIQVGDADKPRPTAKELNRKVTIADNYVHDSPAEYRGGVAVWAAYTQDLIVAHNRIERTPYTGVSVGWGHGFDSSVVPNAAARNQVVANYIAATNTVLGDGGGVYVSGPQGDSLAGGLLVEGNVITDLRTLDYHNAVYLDAGTRFVTVRRNVLAGNESVDWGGCSPFGDIVFEENYASRPEPVWICAIPIRVESRRNVTVGTPADAPAEIVQAAGLRPPYRGLVSKAIP
jgi:hypothetical protein